MVLQLKTARCLRLKTLSILTAMALTGCSLAPELPPAPTAVPTAYSQTPADTAAPQAANLSWQAFFQDPRLQHLLTQALQHNHDLKLAVLNVDRVRALYQITDSNRYPALDLSASQSRQRLPADLSQNGSASVQQQASVTVGSSWELDLFGKVRNQSEQALQQPLITRHIGLTAGQQALLLTERQFGCRAERHFTLGQLQALPETRGAMLCQC